MSKKNQNLQLWPFIPNRPEWNQVLTAWPKIETGEVVSNTGFVGHDGKNFHFQIRGNSTPILVPIE